MENNILMVDEVGQEWLKGILREGLVTISFIKIVLLVLILSKIFSDTSKSLNL